MPGLALAVALVLPAVALAAPPALRAPAVDAAVTVGDKVTYEWSGELQGHESARDRAYFVVEVISASKVPAGQQSPWPDADTSQPTTPGQAATSIELGAPPEGSWKWRVCAWGVVDPAVDNTLVQVPDGCSAPRSLTSKATAKQTTSGSVAVVDEQRTVVVRSAPRVITRTRPADPAPVEEPAPVEPAPVAEPRPEAPKPIAIQRRAETSASAANATSALELGNDDAANGRIGADPAADRTIAGSVADGLTASLPGVPIPYWTLLFLLAALPIAIVWRRSVLGMFEWSDGSIDGYGTPPAEAPGALRSGQRDRNAHASPATADEGAANATSSERSPELAA